MKIIRILLIVLFVAARMPAARCFCSEHGGIKSSDHRIVICKDRSSIIYEMLVEKDRCENETK